MLKLINELNLKYCPCSIEFINKWNLYVVGTYELDEQANESINKRYGSLALIKDNQLILEYDCKNGGVFDFKLINTTNELINIKIDNKLEDNELNNKSNIYLYAAHSNGNLSFYELINNEDKFEIIELKCLESESNMLTSLDLMVNNDDIYVIVGDSCSVIRIFKNFNLINEIKLSEYDYPIWSIKLINIQKSTNKTKINDDKFLLFTGSDDCLLKCFLIQGNNFKDYFQLFKYDLFDGGVTSIEIREEEDELNIELNKSNDVKTNKLINKLLNYKILVGSYDEKLRIFNLNLNSIDCNNRKSQLNCFKLINTLQISNAGIWKIKEFSSSLSYFFLITAMYSGIHFIKNNKLIYSFNNLPLENIANKNLKLENEHLIYGCSLNNKLDQLLITSFYKKKVYCLNIDKELIKLIN